MLQRDAVRASLRQNKVFDEQCDVAGQLRCAALVLSVTAFFLFLYIDVCPQESITVLALGTLMLAWTGPLIVLAGTHMPSGRFKVWQPFEGGFHFVSMQAVGWCLIGLLLAVCMVYLVNFRTLTRFEGQFLLIGIVGFIAQMVLNVSLDTFVADAPVPLVNAHPTSTTKSVVAILLSLSGCAFFVAFDWLLQSTVLLILGALIFCVSAVVLHVGIGWCNLPNFALWQPFVGGNVFMLLQYLGWKFFACTLVSAALLSSTAAEPYSGMASCMGALGLISQLLLLLSLSFFEPASAEASVVPRHHCLPEESAVCGIVLVMTGLFSSLLCHDLLPAMCPSKLRLLGLLCLVLLGAVAPLTHVGGARAIPGYKLWQPFVGGSKFVFIQSVGWTWYGIFVGVALLMHLNNTTFLVHLLPWACLLGSASCATIAFSMLFFRPESDAAAIVSPNGVPHLLPALFTIDMPPELLLGHLLSTATVVLHVLVEGLQVTGTAASLCLTLGLVLSALAVTMIHVSGGRHSPAYRMWQPFAGGNAFVLRQALGWTFFAVFVLFDCVCILASIRNDDDVADTVHGLVLAVGVASVVPHWVLASSIALFEATPTPSATARGFRISVPVLANLVLVVGSIVLFSLAESCRLKWQSLSQLFCIFGTVAAVTGLACTHCICGPHMYSNYRLVQPFKGGLRFVVLQSAAWALGALAWMASCTTLYGFGHFVLIDGLLLAIGAMFTAAHVLLLVALFCFVNAPMTLLMHPQAASAQDSGPKPNLVLGVILGVVACCVFALVDMVLLRTPHGAAVMAIPAFPTTACAILALVGSISPVFYLQGRIIYRVLGCTLWSVTIVLGGIFTYTLWCQDDASAATSPSQLYGVLTGSLGLMAHLLLLHSMSSADIAALHWLPRLNHRTTPIVAILAAIAVLHFELQHVLVDAVVSAVFHPMPVLVAVCVASFCIVVSTIVRLLQPTTTVARQPVDFPADVVHHLAAFLPPTDLMALAAASKHHQSLLAPAVWHAMFVAQLRGPQQPRAAMPPKLPVVQPSALFSNTWLVQLERLVLASLFPNTHANAPHALAAPPNIVLTWRHIATLVSRGGAFYHCELCKEFAVVTPRQRVWEAHHVSEAHSVSTWVASPCGCRHEVTHARKMAHRACLERCRTAICVCPPPADNDPGRSTLQPALRTPVTVSEFLAVSVFTRRFVVSASPSVVVCAASAAVCGSLSGLVVWTGGIAILGTIVRSVEFDRAVEQIWNDPPAFPLYIRIINTLGLSSFVQLVAALWADPAWPLQVAFAINTALFLTLTTLAGLIFWKTNTFLLTYTRVPDTMPLADLPPRRCCVLCRLHLCRTTTVAAVPPPSP